MWERKHQVFIGIGKALLKRASKDVCLLNCGDFSRYIPIIFETQRHAQFKALRLRTGDGIDNPGMKIVRASWPFTPLNCRLPPPWAIKACTVSLRLSCSSFRVRRMPTSHALLSFRWKEVARNENPACSEVPWFTWPRQNPIQFCQINPITINARTKIILSPISCYACYFWLDSWWS